MERIGRHCHQSSMAAAASPLSALSWTSAAGVGGELGTVAGSRALPGEPMGQPGY